MGLYLNGMTPNDWSKIVDEASKGGVIGKKDAFNKDGFSYKVFSNNDKMNSAKYRTLSINEISDLSKENFGRMSPDENLKLKKNTYKLIAFEKSKSFTQLEKVNATWINALKWASVASIIFLPVGLFIQHKQDREREDLLKKIHALDDMSHSFIISDVEDDLALEFSTKQRFLKDLNDLAEAFNQKKEMDTVFNGAETFDTEIIKELLSDDMTFAENTKDNIEDLTQDSHSVIDLFKQDTKKGVTLSISGDVQEEYHSKLNETERAEGIVGNLKRQLNLPEDEFEKWSKVIQAVCNKNTLEDLDLLKQATPLELLFWEDSSIGSTRKVYSDQAAHFNLKIDRDYTNNSIKKITVSLDTPIEIYEEISMAKTYDKETPIGVYKKIDEPQKIKIEQKNPLSYHLSLDLSFDEKGELQVDVTRREFTKS